MLPKVDVTDGVREFSVRSRLPVVWALKQAIREHDGLTIMEAQKLVILSPATGNPMNDREALVPGVGYVFEGGSARPKAQ